MTSRVLVTTSHALLEVDVENGRLITRHSGDGLYYGITQNDNNIFVAARGRLVSSDTPPEDERGHIKIFSRALVELGRLESPFPLRDLHQIYWDNGRLLATCSYENLIAIYERGRWSRWYPLGQPQKAPMDVNHFNTISRFPEGLCLVAHNHGDSQIFVFNDDETSVVDVISLGKQSHNIWNIDGQWFTCSSGEGRILGTKGFELETGGFPRGVLFYGAYVLVGISELSERKHRDFTDGCILVFDRDWNYLKTIELPRQGLVLDIMLT